MFQLCWLTFLTWINTLNLQTNLFFDYFNFILDWIEIRSLIFWILPKTLWRNAPISYLHHMHLEETARQLWLIINSQWHTSSLNHLKAILRKGCGVYPRAPDPCSARLNCPLYLYTPHPNPVFSLIIMVNVETVTMEELTCGIAREITDNLAARIIPSIMLTVIRGMELFFYWKDIKLWVPGLIIGYSENGKYLYLQKSL